MTRLYFHAATNSQTGNPTSEQSSLTVDNNGDASTANRTMDINKGTSETNITCATNATTSAQVCHFTRFVTRPFANTSISAQTWTLCFGAEEDNVNANFPCSSTGKNIWQTLYVWNPASSTKVGDIIDGATANSDFDEPSSAAAKTVVFGTFSGSAVNSIPSGCILVWECMFQITQNNATARTLTFYFDGNTVDTTSGDTPTSMASFLESTQALTFQTNAVKAITSTVTLSQTLVRKKSLQRSNTSTVTTSLASLNILRGKKRTITTTVTLLQTPTYILAHHINIAVPAETVTISTASLTNKKSWVRVLLETVTINSPAPTHVEHVYRPFRNLTENITIAGVVAKLAAKKRTLLN